MILTWKMFLERLVGETPIDDLQSYISRMSMGLDDKMFFVPLVDFDCIVDFGCADGLILSEIHKINSKVKLIGYDTDTVMDIEAENKLGGDAIITDRWDKVVESIEDSESSLLNLSSVIHEVYSYSSDLDIDRFWDEVFNSNFKFIVIRDMIISNSVNRVKGFGSDVDKVKAKLDEKQIESFEKVWGSIDNDYKSFHHLLLKYKYVENWKREVKENYLSLPLEELKSKIPSGYKIILEDSYVLPFLNEQVKKDFGIEFRHNTHLKMIIEKV